MDAVSLITGVIVIGIFLLIFLLPTINRKKNDKKMYAKLQALADAHNAKITEPVIFGDAIVALDDKKTMLLFYKQLNETEVSKSILLNEIKSCKVGTKTKAAKSTNENFNQFERVSLLLLYLDKNKSEISLELYNHEDNAQLNFDMKLLEQWTQTLNATLKLN